MGDAAPPPFRDEQGAPPIETPLRVAAVALLALGSAGEVVGMLWPRVRVLLGVGVALAALGFALALRHVRPFARQPLQFRLVFSLIFALIVPVLVDSLLR